MATEYDLDPISPRGALELYLQDCRGELSPNTVRQKEYRLTHFVEWCAGDDRDTDDPRLTDLNEIRGRDFLQFKNWRRKTSDINLVTLKSNLSDLRQFMKFCVEIDAVPPTVPEKVGVPVLDSGENRRDTFMGSQEAIQILDHLNRYQYASLEHTLFLLLWETGARMSGLHSLDVGDVDVECDEPQAAFRHRPEQGTRLKNGEDGERIAALKPETARVVSDYIEMKRREETDEYGREPLFTSPSGRMHKRHLSKYVYRLACPCEYGAECPSGKDPSTCEYTGSYDASLECPHTTRPHDIRRGSITEWLRNEVPEKVVSDRMDVSEQTIERHYDERTEQEKTDLRRQYLDDV